MRVSATGIFRHYLEDYIMYQIISTELQVITIYASTLKEAISEAHEAGIKIISITELRK